VVVVYVVVAVTLVLILRQMSRRWRAGDDDFEGGPYEPRVSVP
jgi:hypothetical protein